MSKQEYFFERTFHMSIRPIICFVSCLVFLNTVAMSQIPSVFDSRTKQMEPAALSQKLFKGQNTHPLSQAEKQAFWKKLKFASEVTAAQKKLMLAMVKEAMEIPTGREQIRRAIAHKQPFYNVKIVKNLGNSGAAESTGQTVMIDQGKIVNPKSCSEIFMHELLHLRQDPVCDYNASLNVDQGVRVARICDSETIALSLQLCLEFGIPSDCMYKQAYEKNVEKWRQVAEGKLPRPQNIPPLVYEPNLTPAEKEQAKVEYAQLLASLECRGTSIKEMMIPLEEVDQNLQSYEMFRWNVTYERHGYAEFFWKGEDSAFFKNPQGNEKDYQQLLKDIASRNHLFVTPQDLDRGRGKETDKDSLSVLDMAREAQGRYAKGEGKNFAETFKKVLEEKARSGKKIEDYKPKNGNQEIGEFCNKELYSTQYGEELNGRVQNVMHTKILDDNQKKMLIIECIRSSKNDNPEPNDDRTEAIKKVRVFIGSPNFPIVKASIYPQEQNPRHDPVTGVVFSGERRFS